MFSALGYLTFVVEVVESFLLLHETIAGMLTCVVENADGALGLWSDHFDQLLAGTADQIQRPKPFYDLQRRSRKRMPAFCISMMTSVVTFGLPSPKCTVMAFSTASRTLKSVCSS